MKKIICLIILMTISVVFICCSPANAGQVKLTQIDKIECIKRFLDGNDNIQVLRFVDPDNPFVAIFFTRIESGKIFAMANPSNTAIAARLVAPVPVVNGKRQIDTRRKDNIVVLSQSIFSKEMRIARSYDKEMDTLCYTVYSTKLIDGSLKHSLSVVPLGMPLMK